MLAESDCRRRKCVHYEGVKRLEEEESSEVHYCAAFPDGIPVEISYEEDLHLTPTKEQKNKIVYEKSDE